jgi:hypothetical protein
VAPTLPSPAEGEEEAEVPAGEAAPSSTTSEDPCLTLSPSLTLTSLTTPADEEGISIDALSDSTVTSDCSALTVSPGLTSTSMTETSSKSPMSGTFTSIDAMFLFSGGAYRVKRTAD